jgi:hypothetical protein
MAIHSAYHKVVSLRIIDASALVGIYSLIELEELVAKLSNRPSGQVMQVSHGVACVFAIDPHLAGEG